MHCVSVIPYHSPAPLIASEDQKHAEETKMAQVTFGLFDWIDRGKAPLYQLYEERLQLRHLCVRLGHLPPCADAALAPPVRRGGDAGLRWQRRAPGVGPRQLSQSRGE